MTGDSLHGVSVAGKIVYPPPTISLEAQRLLSASASAPPVIWPEPGQTQAWRDLIAESARVWDARLAAERADLPLAIEETSIAGVGCFACSPPSPRYGGEPLYLFVHGGAFVNGAGGYSQLLAARSAAALGIRTVSIDYRMPPDHPFPAGLEDCFAVYEQTLRSRGAGGLFLGGNSAGGNLAAALLLMARDRGLEMPAGLILLTPEVDLTESGDTFRTNRELDVTLRGTLERPNALYANGHDLSDPYLSPLLGDLAGFPPTFLQSGTRDMFLSNTVLFHRKLRALGIAADLHVWEAMPHGFYGAGAAPERDELDLEISRFMRAVLESETA